MKPRERVMLALNHKEPDRIAIDLGASICSSIHKKSYIELKKYLGMEVEKIKMADYVQQLPYLDEAFLERFDVDFRMVQLPAATAPDLEIFRDG
jgi:uroporphyrinogen decarboxylase